jgi:pyruvate formate-lyase/glycerol dehydratase family glycyl radical enzyme
MNTLPAYQNNSVMADHDDRPAMGDAAGQPMRIRGDIPEIPRLKRLRGDILNAPYHLCTQKASLLTKYMRQRRPMRALVKWISAAHFRQFARTLENSRRGIPQSRWQVAAGNTLNRAYLKLEKTDRFDPVIEFSRALEYILREMPLTVYDHELIVGNSSAHRVGAPIHPDLGGLMMLPEIDGLAGRPINPIQTDPGQIRELHENIFPFWFNRSVMARAPLYSRDPDLFNTLLEGNYYILTQFAGISHVTPDYPTLLKFGFNGIRGMAETRLKEALERLAKLKSGTSDPAKARAILKNRIAFYQSAVIVADAAIEYGSRWKSHLEQISRGASDPARKAELDAMAAMFANIPAHPPASFHEAVQMVFMGHVMLHQENFQHGVSFGRMDQYLYPFYARDVRSGRLTPGRAAEILGCFICKAGELVPLFFDRATEYFSGLSSASGITLGGTTPDGTSGVNDLSYLILLAYDQVRLRQPNFHVRLDDHTPREFRHLCYDVLKKGGGIPAFFNDHAVIPALMRADIAEKDARDYAVVGCVEWGVPGKSFPAAGAVFINLAMALHLALHNGRFGDRPFGPPTGPPERFSSMDLLLDAFRKQLAHLVERAVDGNNAIEQTHANHRPTPLLSVLVDGCMEKGREINAGGARYNSTGCQGVGLADVVDSLTAIDQIVYQEKRLTLSALITTVDADFEECEELRIFIVNKLPKYGENSDLSDHYASLVSGIYTDTVRQFSNPRGGPYYAGFWTMTTHMGFGTRMPALPSGRPAGRALANGASPCDGKDRKGPTAALSSAANLDNRFITNGYAFNQKLNPEYLPGQAGNLLLDGMITGYFKKGGMQLQFNITDPSILLDARVNPEKYPDLVVRVSGYSAYFNDLTDAMKEELINRTLHCMTERTCCT